MGRKTACCDAGCRDGASALAAGRTHRSEPRSVARSWSVLLSLPFVLAIRVYQAALSPLMGGHCRFMPTCSEYAIGAYREHGPMRGTWLTLRRLARCHPWGGHGFDPVPERRERAAEGGPR
ncbi:MAG: membrane protein insertion efficiency factor YidD [Phycisphaerales bacterium]